MNTNARQTVPSTKLGTTVVFGIERATPAVQQNNTPANKAVNRSTILNQIATYRYMKKTNTLKTIIA